MFRSLIRYTLFGLLFGGALYYLPQNRLQPELITSVTLATILLLIVIDAIVAPACHEGMDELAMLEPKCNSEYKIPNQYLYDSKHEDYLQTGLVYDQNLPGYYLINNGKYATGIDYSKVDKLICLSKFKDLLNQHNFNIPFSPHTHIGKERGYLNWDKLVQ